MRLIAEYFKGFPGVVDGRYKGSIMVINFIESKARNSNLKGMVNLFIVNEEFIRDHFIPLFASLD